MWSMEAFSGIAVTPSGVIINLNNVLIVQPPETGRGGSARVVFRDGKELALDRRDYDSLKNSLVAMGKN